MTLPPNKNLESLFDLPPATDDIEVEDLDDIEVEHIDLESHGLPYQAIDKIEAALPAVRNLDASDKEMDELAERALECHKDLLDMGMNVDARAAAEIFQVASQMLGHAITARQAKLNKKLKMIELQLKKAKLDFDTRGKDEDSTAATAQGRVFDRNDLLDMLKNNPH
jgi:hypothetical protein